MKNLEDKLSKLQIAIVIAHSMNRLLKQFETHERTKAMDKMLHKLNKMLRSRERTNLNDFVFSTEYERILWQNVCDKYDKSTPLFGLNVTIELYTYFADIMKKYATINENLAMQVAAIHGSSDIDNDEFYSIEQNDGDFVSTYIETFEEHSGVGLRKSLFAGKKLTIKNNLIVEGKKVKDGF